MDIGQIREGIHEFFKTFPFFQLLGLELLELEPGRARIRMPFRTELSQPAGLLHGGAIAALVDTTFAHAILLTPEYLRAQAAGGSMVTIDLRIKYFRPTTEGAVICEATLPRVGRQIVHAEALVRDDDGREVARGDSIYMILGGRRG